MARSAIVLLGEPFVNEDGVADEAITPGHLVDGVTTIGKAAVAAIANRTYALERDERGSGIDVAYASGDTVKVGSFGPGMRVYAWLASGADVAAGELMEAHTTDGELFERSTGVAVARALEAITNTGSAVPVRIRVEVV